jgi:F-type H+-transporting ATPase subunit b
MTRIGRLTLLTLALLAGAAMWAPRAARAVDVEKAGTPAAGADTHGGGGHGPEEKAELLRGPDTGGIINAITTLIVFLVLVAVLGKYAWGPIAGGLKAREDKIRQDIAEAEAARARSEATLREYQTQLATAEQKVRDLLAKATADAEQIAAGVRTRAQQDAEETKNKATREIDAARKDAVRQVHEQAAVLATNVAEKILRRNLNAADQRDLVAASLDQLSMMKN